mgnify:CR=1 FL=1
MDEQALIASARKGDARAFNQLVLLYQSMAYNVAYRIVGEGSKGFELDFLVGIGGGSGTFNLFRRAT